MKEKEIRSIFSFNLEKKRDKLNTISQLQISEKKFEKICHLLFGNSLSVKLSIKFFSHFKETQSQQMTNFSDSKMTHFWIIMTLLAVKVFLTVKECLEALKDMDSEKSSPRIDGLPAEFYKTFWMI